MKKTELERLILLLELYSESDEEFPNQAILREKILTILKENNIVSYQVSEVNELEDK